MGLGVLCLYDQNLIEATRMQYFTEQKLRVLSTVIIFGTSSKWQNEYPFVLFPKSAFY